MKFNISRKMSYQLGETNRVNFSHARTCLQKNGTLVHQFITVKSVYYSQIITINVWDFHYCHLILSIYTNFYYMFAYHEISTFYWHFIDKWSVFEITNLYGCKNFLWRTQFFTIIKHEKDFKNKIINKEK